MRNFIAVVFPTEAAAYEGLRELKRLHADGTITVYETAVIARDSNGEVVTKQDRHNERPLKRSGVGAVVGALAGILAGPVGVVFGSSVGVFGGVMDDAIHATISEEYVEDVASHMEPSSFAVIAEIHETDTTAVDASMAQLGGKILRETRRDFFGDLLGKRAEARRADAERDRVQRASEQAERKANYVEADAHDALDKLRRTAEAARDELDLTHQELDDKLQALDEQLAAAEPPVRDELEKRVADIRKDLGERERKLTRALAIANEALHR